MSTNTSLGFAIRLVVASLVHSHLYKHITQHVSAILNEIESKKCFTHKTTTFHHVANNFTSKLRTSNDEQFYNDVGFDVKYASQLL